jgi:hypothetical protein
VIVVLVQREMESGRRSVSEYIANSEGQCAQPEAVAARRKGPAAETATGFKKKEVSLANLIHSTARAAAENQLATKRIFQHTRCQAPQQAAVPAASRWRIPAGGGCKGSRRVSVSGLRVNCRERRLQARRTPIVPMVLNRMYDKNLARLGGEKEGLCG